MTSLSNPGLSTSAAVKLNWFLPPNCTMHCCCLKREMYLIKSFHSKVGVLLVIICFMKLRAWKHFKCLLIQSAELISEDIAIWGQRETLSSLYWGEEVSKWLSPRLCPTSAHHSWWPDTAFSSHDNPKNSWTFFLLSFLPPALPPFLFTCTCVCADGGCTCVRVCCCWYQWFTLTWIKNWLASDLSAWLSSATPSWPLFLLFFVAKYA